MAGMVCPFFGASIPKSTGGSIISSIMIEIGVVGILIPKGTLQRRSHKYSS